MDDGWICDDDQGLNDDGVDQFINESESQSNIGSSVTGPGVVRTEEEWMRRHEKKELDKIARRFKVITPAEFERNLSMVGDVAGADRAVGDSWCGNNTSMNAAAG